MTKYLLNRELHAIKMQIATEEKNNRENKLWEHFCKRVK
jgi:acid stress-induced BolA-like protein IbaG/YrbA